MPQTVSSRRRQLGQGRALIDQMIQLNESASRVETQLVARGASVEEIRSTLNKILDAAGPYGWEANFAQFAVGGGLIFGGGTAPDKAFSNDTLSDRVMNLLSSGVPNINAIDWTAELEEA